VKCISEDKLTFMVSRIAGFDSCSHVELILEVVSVILEKANLTKTNRTVPVCQVKLSM